VEFEWDRNKADNNQRKHGISFSEASTVFGDSSELIISEPDHSQEEYRFLSLGKSVFGNLLLVSYTERQENRIRIISARTSRNRS